MVSTNNFFAALLELPEKSESSDGADQDDGFIEIRLGCLLSLPCIPLEVWGSVLQ